MRHFFVVSGSLLVLSLSTSGFAAPKYGPANAPLATRLSQSTEYVRKNPAPDYWALAPYYVSQQWGGSCSLASLTMVTNAARVHQNLTSDDALATEKGLLKKVDAPLVGGRSWAYAVGAEGITPSGVTLDQLGALVPKALEAYGLKVKSVAVVHIEKADTTTRSALRTALLANEKSDSDFIIANFDQKKFTDDSQAGHIAPIAAYDAAKKRVLVMDPDREYYEPYWVSEETFLNGMNTPDSAAGKNRGYVHVTVER